MLSNQLIWLHHYHHLQGFHRRSNGRGAEELLEWFRLLLYDLNNSLVLSSNHIRYDLLTFALQCMTNAVCFSHLFLTGIGRKWRGSCCSISRLSVWRHVSLFRTNRILCHLRPLLQQLEHLFLTKFMTWIPRLLYRPLLHLQNLLHLQRSLGRSREKIQRTPLNPTKFQVRFLLSCSRQIKWSNSRVMEFSG